MPAERAGDRSWQNAVRLIAGATVLRILVAAALPLVPDEAYYWLWSQHLAAGYFDHPPGIALAIHAGTLLMGASRLGVRIGPILAGTLAALAVAATARRLGGSRAALRAAVVMTVLPLAAAGLVLATPDAPLLAWYACTLYAVVRALQAPPRSRESLLWWAVAGVALGLTFCSKYTSILLPVGVLVALATHRELRPRLREPGPYLSAVIATLVFSPVLLWNARHEWISFTFQLRHGLSPARGSLLHTALKFEGELFGGQLGLASPILFVMMAIAVVCALRRRSPLEWLLAVVSVVVFALFVYSALHKRVEANWPAPAYVSAIALLCITDWGIRGRRWLVG
ncbi:MAG TPA: glycosyltransferase family 39 protein, partial [Longimicrobiaceae bacterium]|nr:glycosyltransferase family 39 protein [Longimicrobiaceae bacterium]